MDRYKPQYLGKMIAPADDSGKITDFVVNKYDAFSKIYDACKNHSDKISDVKVVESDDYSKTSISIKVTTDADTIETIRQATGSDPTINIKGDVISCVTSVN